MSPPGEIPLWERACSRRRSYIQHQCKLTHRHREQAQLPQRIDGGRLICERSKNLWEPSLLAMTVLHPASMQADPPPSRASSAPTEDRWWTPDL
ncbi:hypothetical protein F7R20_28740 [Pseudomonas brassicacearum subsp. brassicacearum]|nr:hypothetical protein F7R20_28740 [Pseudomonas brassicacearum subsp. brassicacearum]QEO81159.1 hypothetical protein ELZ14_27775 [Pseudomonas brassicacearum]